MSNVLNEYMDNYVSELLMLIDEKKESDMNDNIDLYTLYTCLIIYLEKHVKSDVYKRYYERVCKEFREFNKFMGVRK